MTREPLAIERRNVGAGRKIGPATPAKERPGLNACPKD